MPIYEYQCQSQSCDYGFEEIQKFSDEPLVVCPKCGKPTLKKMLSLGSFHLKGNGWSKRRNTIGIKRQDPIPTD